MFSKKNNLAYLKRDAQQVPHFAIRKLGVGVCSVLLATTFLFGGGAKADTANSSSQHVTPPAATTSAAKSTASQSTTTTNSPSTTTASASSSATATSSSSSDASSAAKSTASQSITANSSSTTAASASSSATVTSSSASDASSAAKSTASQSATTANSSSTTAASASSSATVASSSASDASSAAKSTASQSTTTTNSPSTTTASASSSATATSSSASDASSAAKSTASQSPTTNSRTKRSADDNSVTVTAANNAKLTTTRETPNGRAEVIIHVNVKNATEQAVTLTNANSYTVVGDPATMTYTRNLAETTIAANTTLTDDGVFYNYGPNNTSSKQLAYQAGVTVNTSGYDASSKYVLLVNRTTSSDTTNTYYTVTVYDKPQYSTAKTFYVKKDDENTLLDTVVPNNAALKKAGVKVEIEGFDPTTLGLQDIQITVTYPSTYSLTDYPYKVTSTTAVSVIVKDHLDNETVVNPAAKTPIPAAHVDNLTADEKTAIGAAVTAANANVKNVSVDDSGNATITFADDSTAKIDKQWTTTSVDLSKLKAAIDQAKQVVASYQYYNATSKTKDAYDNAITKAKLVLADDTASQATVDAATSQITTATTNLDGKATDISELQATITKAFEAIPSPAYRYSDDDIKAEFETAVTQARTVVANNAASQEQVDVANKDLLAALAKLNGTTRSLQEAKDAINQLTHLNDAQKQTAKDALQTAWDHKKDRDDFMQIVADATTTDTKMVNLASDENYTNATSIMQSIVYSQADDNLKQAYENALAAAVSLLGATTGVSTGDVAADSAAVQKVIDNLDNAATALNGQANFDQAKKTAITNAAANYPALNDAQLQTAITRLQAANTPDELAEAKTTNAALNASMQELAQEVTTANETKQSSNYQAADQNLKAAFDNAVSAGSAAVAKNGADLDLTQSEALITQLNDALQALNGNAKLNAKQMLQQAVADAATIVGSDAKYYNANDNAKTDYTDAIAHAKSLLANDAATLDQYVAAVDQISQAYDKLDGQETDKAKLRQALAEKSQTMQGEKYYNGSEETKKAYDDAITHAQAINDDANASQKRVDDAVGAVEAAKAKLDGQETDKTKLRQALAEQSQTMQGEKYYNGSEETKKAYDDAITHAQAINDDTNASQKQVDDAVGAVEAAKAKLNGQETDKSVLDAKIAQQAKLHQSDDYQFASSQARSDYDATIEAAKQVQADVNATQEKTDAMVAAINAAEDKLAATAKAAAAKVNQAIKKTPVGDKTQLTDDEIHAIKQAIAAVNDAAVAVDVNATSGRAVVEFSDGAKAAIAVDKLTTATNKAALSAAVATAESESTKINYATASQTAKDHLDDAVSVAKAVLANPTASQKTIDEATAALDSAMKALSQSATTQAQTTLAKAIDAAAAVSKTAKYYNADDALINQFDAALAHAKKVSANSHNQLQIYLDAAAHLVNATTNLNGKTSDYAKLTAAVVAQERIVKSSQYRNATKTAQAEYLAAIATGKAVLNDKNATQATIDAALQKINAALAGLARTSTTAAKHSQAVAKSATPPTLTDQTASNGRLVAVKSPQKVLSQAKGTKNAPVGLKSMQLTKKAISAENNSIATDAQQTKALPQTGQTTINPLVGLVVALLGLLGIGSISKKQDD